MSDVKISELPAAASVNNTDLVVVVQGGTTKQASVSQLPSGGGGTVPTGTGFRHVTAGAEDAAAAKVDPTNAAHITVGGANTVLTSDGSVGAWSSIANANVSATAAIAGTKIAPDFGAQNVQTTGVVQTGVLRFSSSNIATAGLVRLPSTAQYVLSVRDVANTGNLTGIYVDGANGLNFGSDTTWGAAQTFTTVRFGATTAFQLVLNGATFFYVTSSGPAAYQNVNFGIYGGGSSFPSVGGGVGVMGIGNAGTDPTSNPTGGGILYASGGAGKWRGSSGTVTTFGQADPHCPTCGRDFATEHRNDDLGEHFAICLPCMVDALKGAGIDTRAFAIVDKRGATKAQWDAAHAAAKERAALHAARVVEHPAHLPEGLQR